MPSPWILVSLVVLFQRGSPAVDLNLLFFWLLFSSFSYLPLKGFQIILVFFYSVVFLSRLYFHLFVFFSPSVGAEFPQPAKF